MNLEDSRDETPSLAPSTPPPARAPVASEHESESARALRIAIDTRALARTTRDGLSALRVTVTDLVHHVGEPPDPLRKGDEGSGLAALLFALSANMQKLSGDLAAFTKAFEADAQRALDRRAPWSKAAWIVIGAALALTTGGALTALVAFVARHWH